MNTPVISTPDLPADYYLTNFQLLVDWVQHGYYDLLNHEELHFLECFQQLQRNSQCLFVRLASRKGPFFRHDKLHYSEIDSVGQAATELVQVGLLSSDSLFDLKDTSNLLTKLELISLFNEHSQGMKQLRKEDLVSHLSQLLPELRNWKDWTKGQFGAIYQFHSQPIISNFLLLFFGNTHQNLTEFVLQDLGLFRYENYIIDRQHRIFKSRDELEQYRQLIILRENLEQATSAKQLIQIAGEFPISCTNEKLERRRARLCNQLAYRLEQANQHQLALQLYNQSHLPPARERRIRLLEKQGEFLSAWTLLNEVIKTPCNEQELQSAQRISPRLAKKLGMVATKKKTSSIFERQVKLSQLFDEQGRALCVEDIVRQSIHTAESPCFYVENLLLTGLFGLWLWPEMFRGIEGAFANPFQSAPLDLYQENFVAARPNIDQLWLLLENNQYADHVRLFWQEKNGIANHFVNWQFLDRELLELALLCIPVANLKSIFERLLFDIKNNRNGLPDLIQFYPETASYRMIEVKGPGDRIQDNQQRWLDYFIQKMIPAEVWYVSWQ